MRRSLDQENHRQRSSHDLAQAKARKMDPRLLVVKHPVGGLNTAELAERIDTAWAALQKVVG